MQSNHQFKKRFGQNFLRDPKWPQKVALALDIKPGEKIIEIGPGEGILTKILLDNGANLTSIEIDPELYPKLQEKFAGFPNFNLMSEDILQINLPKLVKKEEYKVAGSLPYNISKKIIRLFLTLENPPKAMSFVVQKEVADKYRAKGQDENMLSISAAAYSKVQMLEIIPKGAFYPVPKVDGAILLFSDIYTRYQNVEKILKFVKVGFAQPRKQLANNLANIYKNKAAVLAALEKLGLNLAVRPSELSLANWQALYSELGME